MTLDKVKKNIEPELIAFEKMLLDSTHTEYEHMREIASNLYNLSGKRIRPILTLLVAKLHGAVTTEHLITATIIELTHCASLIHDDVLDEAYLRRGEPTMNAMLRSKGAVLVGDFLLASGIKLGVENKNYTAIEIATKSMQQLVEGEIKQMYHATMLNITMENYYAIIKLKTACLLSASAMAGATRDKKEKMSRFGELLGEAFQIQDDVLDFIGDSIGKELFCDIKEKKITLPLLLAMELAEEQQPNIRTEIINRLQSIENLHNDMKQNGNQNNLNENNVQWIAQFVINSNAIDKCTQIIDAKRQEAIHILMEYPKTEARDTLEEYALFLTQRNY